ncbi:hypothetical protein C5S35_11080 [Candidatus Methanophagaceae archaeon]|nr:hypothetical protein C5S35_11080 [Methanophagales archaeon]
MNCPNCESESPEDAKFCPKCGFSLKKNTKSPERIAVSPNINVSPTITASGNEEAKVEFATAINVSPVITLEPVTKPEIKDKEVLERIERLEGEIKRIPAVESSDLRHLEAKYGKEDWIRVLESFRIVLELDRMCNRDAKTEDYRDKLSALKNYTEGFSEDFTKQVDEFARFMEQEQIGYLDDEYKEKVRSFCTSLIDVGISEFLEG